MHSRFRVVGSLLAIVTLSGGLADHVRGQVFRSGIELVQITATVRDRGSRLVGDLERDDFEVFEDGVRQTVTQFERGRVPVSVGVLLDVSESMYGQRMGDARDALDRFLVDLLEPSDEVFLIVFNHDPHLEEPWTVDPAKLGGRLSDVRPYGATAIYDAMAMALPLFESRTHQRAAVVLISDGSDTASDVSLREIQQTLRHSDAFVYAVAIDAPESRPINDRVNLRTLRSITDGSGGYTEVIHDSPDLGPATERIAEELNHQYTLGYTPNHEPDGRFHRIRVQVKDRDYQVRARQGYVAATRRRP